MNTSKYWLAGRVTTIRYRGYKLQSRSNNPNRQLGIGSELEWIFRRSDYRNSTQMMRTLLYYKKDLINPITNWISTVSCIDATSAKPIRKYGPHSEWTNDPKKTTLTVPLSKGYVYHDLVYCTHSDLRSRQPLHCVSCEWTCQVGDIIYYCDVKLELVPQEREGRKTNHSQVSEVKSLLLFVGQISEKKNAQAFVKSSCPFLWWPIKTEQVFCFSLYFSFS